MPVFDAVIISLALASWTTFLIRVWWDYLDRDE